MFLITVRDCIEGPNIAATFLLVDYINKLSFLNAQCSLTLIDNISIHTHDNEFLRERTEKEAKLFLLMRLFFEERGHIRCSI